MDGKPKMVSERYLGSAADIEALLDARGGGGHARSGPGTWGSGMSPPCGGCWTRLGVIDIIDEVVGARRPDAGASVGTYLALAALGRLVEPRSKQAFADWWKHHRRGPVHPDQPAVLDHRKFWDAMHAVGLPSVAGHLSPAGPGRMIEIFDLDISAWRWT